MQKRPWAILLTWVFLAFFVLTVPAAVEASWHSRYVISTGPTDATHSGGGGKGGGETPSAPEEGGDPDGVGLDTPADESEPLASAPTSTKTGHDWWVRFLLQLLGWGSTRP